MHPEPIRIWMARHEATTRGHGSKEPTGTGTGELTSHEPMTPRQQEGREQNESVGVRESGWDGVVDWGSSLVGGSPNVTGGCEKMGNWRSRSGQAILRECRAVGKIRELGSQGLPGHLGTPAPAVCRGGQSLCANTSHRCLSALMVVFSATHQSSLAPAAFPARFGSLTAITRGREVGTCTITKDPN